MAPTPIKYRANSARFLLYFTHLMLFVGFYIGEAAKGEISYEASSHKYNNVPEHLQLTHVVVVTRHGDRAQITRALSPMVPESDSVTRFWMSQLPENDVILRMAASATPYIVHKKGGEVSDEVAGKLFSGSDSNHAPYAMLTNLGARQLIAVGNELRRRYVGTLMPRSVEDASNVMYCRSTNICRTIQSLRSLLAGLYDIKAGENTSEKRLPYITTRIKSQETLFPHADGPCAAMSIRRNTLFSHYMNSSTIARWSGLEYKLKQDLGIASERIGWLTWLNIMEVLVASQAHNITLPRGINKKDVEWVYDLVGWTWEVLYKDDKLRPLAIGRFVREMVDRLDLAVNWGMRGGTATVANASSADSSFTKMMIYSGHDSTMVPLLCALGLYNGSWPPYASFLTLEIAVKKAADIPTANAGQSVPRYVRAVYNDKDMIMEGCSGKLWCPYEDFLIQMSRTALSQAQYQAICNITNSSMASLPAYRRPIERKSIWAHIRSSIGRGAGAAGRFGGRGAGNYNNYNSATGGGTGSSGNEGDAHGSLRGFDEEVSHNPNHTSHWVS